MFSDPQKIIDQLSLAPGQTVLDFGAGSGHYSLIAAQKVGPSGRIYAIDIQTDLLRRIIGMVAEKGLMNVSIITADLEKPQSTNLKPGLADWAFVTNLLFMLKDRKNILAEAFRLLKPNGRLLLVDWKESFSGLGPQADQVVKEDVVKQMAEQVGFIVQSNIEAGEHHYGLILKKQ
jgi:ubiquinone/menaquinone biosynthesis C-methylase UbiE